MAKWAQTGRPGRPWQLHSRAGWHSWAGKTDKRRAVGKGTPPVGISGSLAVLSFPCIGIFNLYVKRAHKFLVSNPLIALPSQLVGRQARGYGLKSAGINQPWCNPPLSTQAAASGPCMQQQQPYFYVWQPQRSKPQGAIFAILNLALPMASTHAHHAVCYRARE